MSGKNSNWLSDIKQCIHYKEPDLDCTLVEVNLNMILFAGSSLVYGWVVSGPIQITLSILGVIGNILSIIVFTRPTMKSDINFILIGKYTYKVQLF